MLRLVNAHAGSSAAVSGWSLSPDDPRWVLAARAAVSLDGGRAAILTADKRRRLMTLARRMGLRPFDAALVIAIVQDAARSGGHVPSSTGLAPDFASRLALIRPADAHAGAPASVAFFALAILLASGFFFAAMYWLGA